LEGFQYPLEDVTVKAFSSLGISNEIIEEQALIRVKNGVLLVIEARD
jgi:thiamine pyrophosphokinase